MVGGELDLFLFDDETEVKTPPKATPKSIGKIPKQPEVLAVERHNTPSGVLILEFNVRTRKYQRLQIGSNIMEIDSPDRDGIMPTLVRLGCIPAGWRRIYGVTKVEAD